MGNRDELVASYADLEAHARRVIARTRGMFPHDDSSAIEQYARNIAALLNDVRFRPVPPEMLTASSATTFTMYASERKARPNADD